MDARILERRLERERRARAQAESLLESKSTELYEANESLRRTGDELALQSAQLAAILDNALTGICMADRSRTIVRANAYAHRVFGYPAGALCGMNLLSVFDPEDVKRTRAVGLEMADLGNMQGEEMAGRTRTGGIVPLQVSASELYIRDERFTLWIFHDITARKQREAEQARLEDELRRAQKLESLGTLSSGIAHEINTPVQFIGDNLHFLKDAFEDLMGLLRMAYADAHAGTDGDGPDGEEFDYLAGEIPQAVEQSIEGVTRIAQIVRAVREFSHPGTSEKAHVDINQAIESSAIIATSQWKYVASLVKELDEKLPPVFCVPGEINQVILNLITNAAQAIEAAGNEEPGTILLATRRIGDEVEIRISDNGCGIPEDIRPRIFDPFFTTKDVGKGTGQGLSLVLAIVVGKHGGKIHFDTRTGEGTSFVVRLPIGQAVPERTAA